MIEAAHSDGGNDDDDQPFPPGPLARHVGLLKAAVYIMSILLVVGTMVLVGAIIWKASRLPATTATASGGFEALEIAVPAGASVASVEIDGERMALTLDGNPGEGVAGEIVIVDIGRGEIVGRIRLTPETPTAGAAAGGAAAGAATSP